jgi:hypothetical protein
VTARTDSPSTSSLVRGFAHRFDATHLAEHGVGSPLGLWLLLALLAPASTGDARVDLERVLGTDADDAAQRAALLLDGPHPAVSSAVAVWSDELAVSGDGFDAWVASLPRSAQTGPVPSQEAADRWAAEHTQDLIRSFPVSLDPRVVLVLASALATKVTWTVPFDEVPAGDLGGAFGARVTSALASSATGLHDQFLARTEAAGLVGALVARSGDGLVVTSVIAEPAVATAAVHAAAHEVAALVHGDPRAGASRVSLFDLPLGPGHAWEVREVVEERFGGSPTSEVVDAVAPAWAISSRHDLSAGEGVGAAFDVLGSFLDPIAEPATFEAVQSAVAAFSREGFEAAAVTAFAVRAGGVPSPVEVRERSATIRFNRPFAVVATATGRVPDVERGWGERDLGVPHWEGVPVFGAWVGRVPAEG